MLKITATRFNLVPANPKKIKNDTQAKQHGGKRQSVFFYGIAEHILTDRSTMSDANESYNTQTTTLIQYITFAEERNIEQGQAASH